MENLIKGIFKKSKPAEATPKKFYCAKCGREIDVPGVYLRLTGDYLHTGCLVKYMLSMNILEDIKRHKKAR